ncbi:uncharacterized protein Z519_06953 [Cladophialophora bantiana CBS 173.52]|uniref:Heterokaryon incompatibility domain-containing protein n=1 Tax=Cladophialophora bantiana (strain ATCC 10958 / CBS 173.52 / CDC B-1940 / NIH 8579) TaxID=1442370 RepID=A0A0D2EPU4_CLAB1|nr:uncharacterized protein Z519_06953 [Cladophialophora bantiana CBS 173.52]KIW91971.1 hypothetical protein Z519_06953 [Cladophialophora bantiana CBS 173.52]
MNSPIPLACTCRSLHQDCDAETCPQKQYSRQPGDNFKLFEFRENAERGCTTCSAIYNALSVEPVKRVWRETVDQSNDASTAEQSISIELMRTGERPGRVVIRTGNSYGSDSRGWRHFNLFVPAEAPESKSCVALRKLKCAPIDKTDSAESYRFLRQWLDECNNLHQCAAPEPPSLPKRVLRLHQDQVHLHLSREDEKARYATLSHRWGSFDESFILEVTNLESLTKNINWSKLPKTAQDAIEICRKLGIEYLWIDALCIIQRYKPDWDEQSEKMCTIYGQSYLNIAAMDSNDSGGGCFRSTGSDKRYPPHTVPGHPNLRIQQQPHFTHLDFGSNYATSSASPPLLRRGWVLQERLLSPRCVYYGKDELLWECKACADCFCGGTNVIARFKDVHHRSLTEDGDPLPFAWMRITERYSCLDLTRDSDRAIALSGIAQEVVASGRGGKYLAGLWADKLAYQLVWGLSSTFRRPKGYIAPSWSWLSVFGKVEYGQNRMDYQAAWSRIAVVITDAAVLASKPDGTGRIKSGYLLLNGMTLDMEAEVMAVRKGGRPRIQLTHSNPYIEYPVFEPDYAMTPEEAVAIEKVVVLYWGRIVYDETFMVLRQVPSDAGVAYERFGLLKADDHWSRQFHGVAKSRTDVRIV